MQTMLKLEKLGKAQTLQIALFSHFATFTRNNATKEIQKRKRRASIHPLKPLQKDAFEGTADKRTAKQELRTKIQRTK
jgi:hypothetical protein